MRTLTDIYQDFSDQHGAERPVWTPDQLRDWLYARDISLQDNLDWIDEAIEAEIADMATCSCGNPATRVAFDSHAVLAATVCDNCYKQDSNLGPINPFGSTRSAEQQAEMNALSQSSGMPVAVWG